VIDDITLVIANNIDTKVYDVRNYLSIVKYNVFISINDHKIGFNYDKMTLEWPLNDFYIRWEWLEDGKMHELMKKSDKVESMDVEDENDNIASLF